MEKCKTEYYQGCERTKKNGYWQQECNKNNHVGSNLYLWKLKIQYVACCINATSQAHAARDKHGVVYRKWVTGSEEVGQWVKHLLRWCKNWSWDIQNLSENPKGCGVLLVIPVIRGQWQISPGESSLARLAKVVIPVFSDRTYLNIKQVGEWLRKTSNVSLKSARLCAHISSAHPCPYMCVYTQMCHSHMQTCIHTLTAQHIHTSQEHQVDNKLWYIY